MSNRIVPSVLPQLRKKLATSCLLVCDVDGVLTDGGLTYGDGGESSKTFHAHDGMGLRMLIENEVEVAIITARHGAAVAKRMSELKVRHVLQGRSDKGRAFRDVLATLGVSAEKSVYIGDDILDLPAVRMAGVGATVADGHPAVRAEADYITQLPGGRGAVRELTDLIIDARIGLPNAIDTMLKSVQDS